MLARLCITSPESRYKLSDELSTFFEASPLTEVQGHKQSKNLLKELYERTTTPTIIEIQKTGILNILGSLDEADWVRLALLCDKCDVSTSNNVLLFELAKQILSNTTSSAITKINAYYFLKSQGISQNSFTEQLVPAILTLENAEAQTEAWAILLADSCCPEDVFSNVNTEQVLEVLSAVIPWTAKNNKDSLSSIMTRFAALQNPELTLELIRFGFHGTIKLERLKETLKSSPALHGWSELNIIFFEKKLVAAENQEEIITQMLADINSINAQFPEKTSELFKLFVAPALTTHSQHLLFTAQKVLDNHTYLLREFSKLASMMEVNSETVAWLSRTTAELASKWNLDTALKALNIEKEISGKSENTVKIIQQDLTKNAVRDIIGQLIFLMTIPGVWDSVVENYGDDFLVSLENILKNDTKDFFRSITGLPWQQNESGQRICSNATIDWLFSLSCIQTLDFIQPNDPSFSANGEIYLGYLFKFNDRYVIKQLFAANSRLESRPLFLGLTKAIGGYATALEPAILPLLTHPDFHIEHYYEHASEAFKQLPQVKAAMQLQYFFHPETVADFVGSDTTIADIKFAHHPETFFQALKYWHSNDLHQMTIALSQSDLASDRTLYDQARSLHKQIKKLPAEARRLLNQDVGFAAFSLAHRICKDKSVNETTSNTKQFSRSIIKGMTQVAKGHLVTGKDAKIPFLECILNHLVTSGECKLSNTGYHGAPFIWSVYVESYLTVKRKMQDKLLTSEDTEYSPDKMFKVNEWLNEQILDGKKTKETLAPLPGDLLKAIFDGTNVEIGEFAQISERLFNEAHSDDGDDDSESKQESVAEAADVASRRTSFFRRTSWDGRKNSVSTPAPEMSFPMEDFWAEVRNPPRVDSLVTACSGSMYAAFAGSASFAVGAPSINPAAKG